MELIQEIKPGRTPNFIRVTLTGLIEDVLHKQHEFQHHYSKPGRVYRIISWHGHGLGSNSATTEMICGDL